MTKVEYEQKRRDILTLFKQRKIKSKETIDLLKSLEKKYKSHKH